jgi:predicted restriction endonuclease
MNMNRIVRYMATRNEQPYLRNYLLKKYPHVCCICNKFFPKFVLECAHIIPRAQICSSKYKDINNVMLLCRNCHKIFDKGCVGVDNNILLFSDDIKTYEDLNVKDRHFEYITKDNLKYFNYHFNNIYKNK